MPAYELLNSFVGTYSGFKKIVLNSVTFNASLDNASQKINNFCRRFSKYIEDVVFF